MRNFLAFCESKKNSISWKSSSLVLLMSLVFLVSCNSCGGYSKWQKNAEMDGIKFDKMRHSKSGTIIGYLSDNTAIQGYPCKAGWIHFYKDRELQNFTLLDSMTINGVDVPTKTWVTLNETGILVRCAFPENIEIQGILCKGTGGPKGAQVSFYASGKLRSFFSPDQVDIHGIPCKGGIFRIIALHENGLVKECNLSRAIELHGVKYKKGNKLYFDENGNVVSTD